MRYIAKKIDEKNYEISGVDTLPTIDGEYIEVIVGKLKQDKENLIKVINDYEEETKFFVEKQIEDFKATREDQLEELKEHLKAIEDCEE